MYFKVNRKTFSDVITPLMKSVPTKTAIPILENFLFRLDKDTLTVIATDTEITMATAVTVEEPKKGNPVCVPARQLLELINALPPKSTVEFDINDSSLCCRYENGQASLPVFPANDFPAVLTDKEYKTTIIIQPDALVAGINAVLYAVADSSDGAPVALTSLLLDIKQDGKLVTAASDRRVLATCTVGDHSAKEADQILLPRKASELLVKFAADAPEDIIVECDAGNVRFSYKDHVLESRRNIGKFPDYMKIMPSDPANVLKAEKAQLLDTLKRVATCSPKSSAAIVTINIAAIGTADFICEDVISQSRAHETLTVDYTGTDFNVLFNIQRLMDAIQSIDDDTIVLGLADPKRAALINGEKEPDKQKTVIMPSAPANV